MFATTDLVLVGPVTGAPPTAEQCDILESLNSQRNERVGASKYGDEAALSRDQSESAMHAIALWTTRQAIGVVLWSGRARNLLRNERSPEQESRLRPDRPTE
jgi:hypothetical protein